MSKKEYDKYNEGHWCKSRELTLVMTLLFKKKNIINDFDYILYSVGVQTLTFHFFSSNGMSCWLLLMSSPALAICFDNLGLFWLKQLCWLRCVNSGFQSFDYGTFLGKKNSFVCFHCNTEILILN